MVAGVVGFVLGYVVTTLLQAYRRARVIQAYRALAQQAQEARDLRSRQVPRPVRRRKAKEIAQELSGG